MIITTTTTTIISINRLYFLNMIENTCINNLVNINKTMYDTIFKFIFNDKQKIKLNSKKQLYVRYFKIVNVKCRDLFDTKISKQTLIFKINNF